MRFTRAAKVAAFPLIVLALVALVACQGGPGTKGDKGDKGDMGDMGTPGGTGTAGPVGPAQLALVADANTLVLINDQTRDDGIMIAGGPTTFNLSDLFSGGVGDRTYSVAKTGELAANNAQITATNDGRIMTVTINDTTVLETGQFVLTAPGTGATTAWQVTVTVSDESKSVPLTQMLTVARNQAPRNSNVEPFDLRIGTQGVKRPTDHNWPAPAEFDCSTLNMCVVKTATLETFFDDDQADGKPKLRFTASASAGNVTVGPVAAGIAIMGVRPTGAMVDGTFRNHVLTEGVIVKVTATDAADKSHSRSFRVAVDAPPMNGDEPLGNMTITNPPGMETGAVIIDLNIAFADPELNMRTYTSPQEDKDSNIVTVVINAENMTLTPGPVRGSRTVTVRATENMPGSAESDSNEVGIGQYYEMTFTVTNAPS